MLDTRFKGQHITPLGLLVPVVTQEVFSHYSGLRPGQVRGQLDRANLPIHKIGKLSLVNIAKLAWDASHMPIDNMALLACPTITADQFALYSGLRPEQVKAQLDCKNLPRHEVGRLVLVDVAELTRQCLVSDSDQ